MAQPNSVAFRIRRYPLATVCAALWVLLLGGLFLRFGALDEAKAELSRQEIEGARIEKNVLNGAGLEKHVASLSAGIAKMEARLIRADDVGTNQQYFYELVSVTGVKLSSLRPAGVSQATGNVKAGNTSYQPFGYNVVVEGSYSQIFHFLQALERGDRHYRWQSFAVQRGGRGQAVVDGPGSVVLNLNLELLASK